MIVMAFISVIFKTKTTKQPKNIQTKQKKPKQNKKNQKFFYSDSPTSWAGGNIPFSGNYQAAGIE